MLFSSPWVQLAINMQLAPHITCRRISSHRRYAWPALQIRLQILSKANTFGNLTFSREPFVPVRCCPCFLGGHQAVMDSGGQAMGRRNMQFKCGQIMDGCYRPPNLGLCPADWRLEFQRPCKFWSGQKDGSGRE